MYESLEGTWGFRENKTKVNRYMYNELCNPFHRMGNSFSRNSNMFPRFTQFFQISTSCLRQGNE